jgi:anaerobic dimethyl sulfoxide reductase subunit B (iron-sulfur subunit)
MMKRPAFHIDLSTCIGCKTCMIACKDKNDLPDGIKWRRVSEYAGGSWKKATDGTFTQDVFAYYASVGCNHCEDPACLKVCPTGAITKNASGIVLIDQKKCNGCKNCVMACPYQAPQFNAALKKASKCDFCQDLLADDKPPACVSACVTRSLSFGEYDDLKKRFGEATQMAAHVAPLPDPSITKPNLLVKPGRTAKPIGSKAGAVVNPEEI